MLTINEFYRDTWIASGRRLSMCGATRSKCPACARERGECIADPCAARPSKVEIQNVIAELREDDQARGRSFYADSIVELEKIL